MSDVLRFSEEANRTPLESEKETILHQTFFKFTLTSFSTQSIQGKWPILRIGEKGENETEETEGALRYVISSRHFMTCLRQRPPCISLT